MRLGLISLCCGSRNLPLIGRLFSEEAQRPETDQMALQGKSVLTDRVNREKPLDSALHLPFSSTSYLMGSLGPGVLAQALLTMCGKPQPRLAAPLPSAGAVLPSGTMPVCQSQSRMADNRLPPSGPCAGNDRPLECFVSLLA